MGNFILLKTKSPRSSNFANLQKVKKKNRIFVQLNIKYFAMAQQKDIITPSGSTFKDATIKGSGIVVFKDTPQNQFDMGLRIAKNGEYEILSVVDRSKEDNAPFAQPITISGFSVKIGTVVNIRLTKNVTNSIPTELIIMTTVAPTNTRINTNTRANTNTSNTTKKSIFTPKNIIISVIAIGAILGLLKWRKVI